MELPRNCANCADYDGDHYCAREYDDLVIQGFIKTPEHVVCAEHRPKESDNDAPANPEA